MNKTEITKQAAKFVVGGSVSFSVANLIRNNVTPETTIQKMEAYTASVVLGMMVAERAETYTSAKIDEAVTWWNENIKKTK